MTSDHHLMASYAAGDKRAFTEIFQRYEPAVRRRIAVHVREEADVRDLVQQTFMQLHRARFDFRYGARLQPLVETIAANLCQDYYRHKGRRREVFEGGAERPDPAGITPDAHLLGKVEKQRLRNLVERLPDGQRDVITMHWFSDLPFFDIAANLGITETAAKVRAHRGYEVLRKHLFRNP